MERVGGSNATDRTARRKPSYILRAEREGGGEDSPHEIRRRTTATGHSPEPCSARPTCRAGCSLPRRCPGFTELPQHHFFGPAGEGAGLFHEPPRLVFVS